jgi:hypothetical protein
MNSKLTGVLLTLCFFSSTSGEVLAQAGQRKEMITIPSEVVIDKIRGGLLGEILGDLNGLPHENAYIDNPGNVQNYVPSLTDGAWTDDDTDFEWFYIFEMQKNRKILLESEYITNLWRERVNRGVWCSNRFVRYLMDIGIKPPYTGYTEFNPWAEFNISGQFLCETYGLLAPGMPQTAAKIGLNYTTVAINGEPAQTTQLFTTMISTAFVENDIKKILDAGIAALDSKSIILQIIRDVQKWHSDNPADWRETRRLLKEKYTAEGGKTRDRNGHELNTGSIIAALLYGNGDFAESLKYAFNFGWDADCNAATVGTIVGTTYGYRRMLTQSRPKEPLWQIVDRYKNVTRDNMPYNETITSFADRLVELFELVNESNGGSKKVKDNVLVYEIATEKAAPVIMLAGSGRKDLLKEELGKQIAEDLNSDTRETRAKAVFLAVCLDMNEQLKKANPKKWNAACYDLSGCWKIMYNLFSGDFQGIYNFSKKFEQAGFKAPLKRYEDQEIYTDKVFWKDPKSIY